LRKLDVTNRVQAAPPVTSVASSDVAQPGRIGSGKRGSR